MAENKNWGGKRAGSGRKPMAEGEKKKFSTISITGSEEEIKAIRNLAKEKGKSMSRLVIETLLGK